MEVIMHGSHSISRFTSLQTLERAFTRKGHDGTAHSSAFAAILDYNDSTSTVIATILSPLAGISIVIKSLYALWNDSVKEDDTIAVFRATLSLKPGEETTVGDRFKIEALTTTLKITDINNNETVSIKYGLNGLYDFQKKLRADLSAVGRKVESLGVNAPSLLIKLANNVRASNAWHENIFEQPLRFGSRGDPLAWNLLSKHFSTQPRPDSWDSFKKQFNLLFKEIKLLECYGLLSEEFATSGMSRDEISEEFWKKTAIPLFKKRMEQYYPCQPLHTPSPKPNYYTFLTQESLGAKTEQVQNKQTQSSLPVYSYVYSTNPFGDLFKKNTLTLALRTIEEPCKEIVIDLMLNNIQINDNNIRAFAARHKDALLKEGVKDKIEQLVNNWKKSTDFNHKNAKSAIKEILGESIADSDVIFMLRMFCITKPKFSNFENNFNDLVEHLSVETKPVSIALPNFKPVRQTNNNHVIAALCTVAKLMRVKAADTLTVKMKAQDKLENGQMEEEVKAAKTPEDFRSVANSVGLNTVVVNPGSEKQYAKYIAQSIEAGKPLIAPFMVNCQDTVKAILSVREYEKSRVKHAGMPFTKVSMEEVKSISRIINVLTKNLSEKENPVQAFKDKFEALRQRIYVSGTNRYPDTEQKKTKNQKEIEAFNREINGFEEEETRFEKEETLDVLTIINNFQFVFDTLSNCKTLEELNEQSIEQNIEQLILQDPNLIHTCVITGYDESNGAVIMTHWGKTYRTTAKALYESSQLLPNHFKGTLITFKDDDLIELI